MLSWSWKCGWPSWDTYCFRSKFYNTLLFARCRNTGIGMDFFLTSTYRSMELQKNFTKHSRDFTKKIKTERVNCSFTFLLPNGFVNIGFPTKFKNIGLNQLNLCNRENFKMFHKMFRILEWTLMFYSGWITAKAKFHF